MKRLFPLLTLLLSALSAETPLRILAVRLVQSPGTDVLEGVAFARDGSLLITGTLGECGAWTFGEPDPDSRYRSGYVARLDPEDHLTLHEARFAPGLLHLTTVVEAADGSVYLGGNSILRRMPTDFRAVPEEGVWRGDLWGFRGRTLFWGGIVRVDPLTGALEHGLALSGRGTQRQLTPAWPVDLAPVGEETLVAARHSEGFRFTRDAWSTAEFPPRSPGASLLLLSGEHRAEFSTSLGEITPFRIETMGRRGAVVGQARSANIVRTGDELELQGPRSGYLLIVERTGKDESSLANPAPDGL